MTAGEVCALAAGSASGEWPRRTTSRGGPGEPLRRGELATAHRQGRPCAPSPASLSAPRAIEQTFDLGYRRCVRGDTGGLPVQVRLPGGAVIDGTLLALSWAPGSGWRGLVEHERTAMASVPDQGSRAASDLAAWLAPDGARHTVGTGPARLTADRGPGRLPRHLGRDVRPRRLTRLGRSHRPAGGADAPGQARRYDDPAAAVHARALPARPDRRTPLPVTGRRRRLGRLPRGGGRAADACRGRTGSAPGIPAARARLRCAGCRTPRPARHNGRGPATRWGECSPVPRLGRRAGGEALVRARAGRAGLMRILELVWAGGR
jgi:hypothetical protein